MALVPHRPSVQSTDPTATLQTALNEFEAALTDQQRGQFLVHTSNAQQHRPTSSTVIQFVAELDATSHGRLKTSVAPRLQVFLDATQQFTNIVDTFVSSNPLLAALVWGGVKTAILAASNVTHYFDKVTALLMVIGKTCPVYQEFALVYSESIPLQSALSEYYAILVRLATKIVEISGRTMLTQLLSSIVSPFDTEFQPLQEQLLEATKFVNLRISLASAKSAQALSKLVEQENEKNRRHRGLFRSFQTDARKEGDALRMKLHAQKTAKAKAFVLRQLSAVNHLPPWNQLQKRRLNHTAEWFSNTQAFRDWQADENASVLWCPGRMGVGKSVLVSNIIAHLFRYVEQDQMIAHHFCRTEHAISASARIILGTIARQLLRSHIENAHDDDIQRLKIECETLDAEDVVHIMLLRLNPNQKHFIIIDGLDECARNEIMIVAKCIDKLCNHHSLKFHILISGRPELERTVFIRATPKYQMPITPTATQTDVGHYIDTTLDQCLEDERIQLTDHKTIITIANVLHEQYIDSFLFVQLYIEELSYLVYEKDILEALQKPPQKIGDLLRQRLDRIRNQNHATTAVKLLQYCGVTKRPLTVGEFSELLSISVFQSSLCAVSVPRNLDQVIAACCGLVYIDEEYDTVHYTHHSIKQHFFEDTGALPPEFDQEKTDLLLGQICLTYFNFSELEGRLVPFRAAVNTVFTPLDIGLSSVRESSSIINKAARTMLRSRTKLQQLKPQDLSEAAKSILGEDSFFQGKNLEATSSFHLLRYAQDHWTQHTTKMNPVPDAQTWRLFSKVVESSGEHVLKPWLSKSQNSDGELLRDGTKACIDWALTHAHTALLTHLAMRHFRAFSYAQVRSTLLIAVETRHVSLARAMTRNADCEARHIATALHIAANHGDVAMFKLFVAAREDECVTQVAAILYIAARRGQLELIDWLLAMGVRVNVPSGTYDNLTALQAAAEGGHLEIVERLLVSGGDPNAVKIAHETALQAAARKGHLKVVDRLLAAGAHVDAGDPKRGTALRVAAGSGHLDVVDRLLAAKANVNATAAGSKGLTALQAAAEGGFLGIVDRLLAAKADVNAVAFYCDGRTALQAAAEGGHLEIVDRLLAANADANAVAALYGGKTALEAAIEAGHLAVVERLRRAGARSK